MQINAAKTALQNLLDLVIDANVGAAITDTKVTLGAPSAFVGTGGRNTQITLTAVANQGFSGSRTIDYTRLGVLTGTATAGAEADAGIQVSAAATEVEIKALLVAQFGLVANQVEVADLVLPVNESTPGSITLAAVADSLLYVGNEVVVLTVADADVPLGDAITNDQMNGFEPA